MDLFCSTPGDWRDERVPKKVEGTKTIVGTSNRFRVVTDVAYDDFMHLERPLGVARVPSRLAAPPRASLSSQTPRLEPSRQVAKSFGKITKNQDLGVLNALSGRQMS